MEVQKLPQGLWPVMLTPFDQDGEIDWKVYDQLISFYITQGADGLFATCGSSEVRKLKDDEIIALAKRAVDIAANQLPVVASAIRFTDRQHQIDMAKRVADTGVDAVVFSSNQFGAEQESESHLQSALFEMAEALPDIPLGVYEYPNPYKRLISPDLLGQIARTGKYVFFKDTCCNLAQLKQKIDAAKGTSLRVYNADVLTLAESLDAGCDGFCGTGMNFIFEPFKWLCSSERFDIQKRESLNQFWPDFLKVVRMGYPMSAKMFLKQRGIDIQPVCRDWDRHLEPPTSDQIDRLMRQYQVLSSQLASENMSVSQVSV
jgi:4-hydroxy-tetrahydrodipicolinate synthase